MTNNLKPVWWDDAGMDDDGEETEITDTGRVIELGGIVYKVVLITLEDGQQIEATGPPVDVQ